jgi:hypothetical protein
MNLVHQQAITSSIRTLLNGIFDFKKRKVDPVHVKKTYMGIGGTVPLSLNLGTRSRRVKLHAPAALLPGNTPVSTEAG